MSYDEYVSVPFDLQQGSEVSSVVERGKLGYPSSYSRRFVVHLSCGRKLEVHLKLQWEFGGSSRVARGYSRVLLRPCS